MFLKILYFFVVNVWGFRRLPTQTIPKLETCDGDVNLSGLRIAKGIPAGENSWPWLVRLEINPDGRREMCGGTLISNNIVLTAAHCCIHATDVKLHFGDWRRDRETMQEFSVRVDKTNIKIHEEYFKADDGSVKWFKNSLAISISLTSVKVV